MPRRITLASLIDKAEGLSLHAVERTSDEERSALEGLPDELFIRIVSFFHDPQAFFSLAATKYSFKEFLYQTRVLLAFALCNQKNKWEHGKAFYRLRAASAGLRGRYGPTTYAPSQVSRQRGARSRACSCTATRFSLTETTISRNRCFGRCSRGKETTTTRTTSSCSNLR